MLIFRKPIEGVERPQMPADVVIVGGGPAGLAAAVYGGTIVYRMAKVSRTRSELARSEIDTEGTESTEEEE